MTPKHNIASRLINGSVRVYQLGISPIIGPRCRHLPTCSDYLREAVERHGAWHGTWMGVRRLLRCHPWGTHGYDPVPEKAPGLPD